MNADLVERLRKLSKMQELKPDVSTVLDAAAAIETLTRQVENLERALRRNGEWQSTQN